MSFKKWILWGIFFISCAIWKLFFQKGCVCHTYQLHISDIVISEHKASFSELSRANEIFIVLSPNRVYKKRWMPFFVRNCLWDFSMAGIFIICRRLARGMEKVFLSVIDTGDKCAKHKSSKWWWPVSHFKIVFNQITEENISKVQFYLLWFFCIFVLLDHV